MCQDCIKFLTDAQEQAKTNETFVNTLIEQIESQCDLLGPGMSDLVRDLGRMDQRLVCNVDTINDFGPVILLIKEAF